MKPAIPKMPSRVQWLAQQNSPLVHQILKRNYIAEGGSTPLAQPKVLLKHLLAMKRKQEPISMVTAYDCNQGALADKAGVDMILVGDSCANVMMGLNNTNEMSMDAMVHHTRAVTRCVEKSYVVGDMPFGSYLTPNDAVRNAGRIIGEGGANAVKLEGYIPEAVEQIAKFVPVVGHLGLLPQTADCFGTRGRVFKDICRLKEESLRLQDAGCSLLVLEKVCTETAKYISQILDIPTIGIASGKHCDGQVLVWHDLLGLSVPDIIQSEDNHDNNDNNDNNDELSNSNLKNINNKYKTKKAYKFVKEYANLSPLIIDALSDYINDVKNKEFPRSENSFYLSDKTRNKLKLKILNDYKKYCDKLDESDNSDNDEVDNSDGESDITTGFPQIEGNIIEPNQFWDDLENELSTIKLKLKSSTEVKKSSKNIRHDTNIIPSLNLNFGNKKSKNKNDDTNINIGESQSQSIGHGDPSHTQKIIDNELNNNNNNNNKLEPTIISNPKELRKYRKILDKNGDNIIFVPFLGGLHDAHLSLIKAAKLEADKLNKNGGKTQIWTSLFLNPTQFNDENDLIKYPMILEDDINLLKQLNCVDLIFIPDRNDMYLVDDSHFRPFIDFKSLYDKVDEAKQRPGHFQGVGTIVAKLFAWIRPTKAIFGQKDFMQCVLIQRLCDEFFPDIKIIIHPTIREENGLAMSSRNRKLNELEYTKAPMIYDCLCYLAGIIVEKLVNKKTNNTKDEICTIGEIKQFGEKFCIEKGISLEYIAFHEYETGFTLFDTYNILSNESNIEHKKYVISIAGSVGPSTRLIDNIVIGNGAFKNWNIPAISSPNQLSYDTHVNGIIGGNKNDYNHETIHDVENQTGLSNADYNHNNNDTLGDSKVKTNF